MPLDVTLILFLRGPDPGDRLLRLAELSQKFFVGSRRLRSVVPAGTDDTLGIPRGGLGVFGSIVRFGGKISRSVLNRIRRSRLCGRRLHIRGDFSFLCGSAASSGVTHGPVHHSGHKDTGGQHEQDQPVQFIPSHTRLPSGPCRQRRMSPAGHIARSPGGLHVP